MPMANFRPGCDPATPLPELDGLSGAVERQPQRKTTRRVKRRVSQTTVSGEMRPLIFVYRYNAD